MIELEQVTPMKRYLQAVDQDFVSSSTLTPQWKSASEIMIDAIRQELATTFGTLDDFKASAGHFYISGFFQVGGQYYYFMSEDVRYGNKKRLLLRTALSASDYSGGPNHFVEITELTTFRKLPTR